MNILFTVNKNHIKHISECIRSIIQFSSQDGYDIYILHSDLRQSDEKYLKEQLLGTDARMHFEFVDPLFFSDFPESGRYPRVIYYRIFAALFLPESLERILYLDGDTVVINPLDELYKKDFEGNYFLACTHVRKFLNKLNQYRLGAEEKSIYINSGVLLINLKELRKSQNPQEVWDYVNKRRMFLALPDQDIITALYGDKIGILDTMKFNLSDRMLAVYNSNPRHDRIDMEWVRKNTVVIHYYGKQKPWKKSYRGVLGVFYWELMEQIEKKNKKE